ncbi:hypothetical protein RISK_006415 [Rhodopirellula islandica]|uniref:Uncharacterized protein n=1 Tax=Rhodopirellula islandica TaxID=595434 RepID=A0A0J1B4M6_RHOIS|nr:hypothetical protein RISK_006415 [Rhodopirellula islandica]
MAVAGRIVGVPSAPFVGQGKSALATIDGECLDDGNGLSARFHAVAAADGGG